MTDVVHRTPGETFAGYTQLVTEVCCSCGVLFAMPQELESKALADHSRYFYCPNGHSQHYTGKTEAEKLRERLNVEREHAARVAAARDQAQAEARAQKGRATRFKNERDKERTKATAGVCPVDGCKRHFVNLDRHMSTKHPDFVAEHHDG